MSYRRTIAALILVAAVPAFAQTRPAADDAAIDAMLVRLDDVGQKMKTLRANVSMQTVDAISGGGSTRLGKVLLERRGEGDTRGHVDFEWLITGEKQDRRVKDRTEFLLDGDWVVDRVYRRPGDPDGGNRETHRQIRAPGTKTDLLKLDAGPFPLPIGQPPEVVKRQFDLKELPPDAKKPGMAGLELKPKETNSLSKRFGSIAVWLKEGEALPTVIETTDREESQMQTTTLTNVELNAPLTDADFKLAPVDEKDWTITREPFEQPKS